MSKRGLRNTSHRSELKDYTRVQDASPTPISSNGSCVRHACRCGRHSKRRLVASVKISPAYHIPQDRYANIVGFELIAFLSSIPAPLPPYRWRAHPGHGNCSCELHCVSCYDLPRGSDIGQEDSPENPRAMQLDAPHVFRYFSSTVRFCGPRLPEGEPSIFSMILGFLDSWRAPRDSHLHFNLSLYIR